jgi:hypothetical protein
MGPTGRRGLSSEDRALVPQLLSTGSHGLHRTRFRTEPGVSGRHADPLPGIRHELLIV